MGSKFSLYSFAFFLLLLLHISFAYEIEGPMPPAYPENNGYCTGVRLPIVEVAEALWDADYKIMSLILDGNLLRILPSKDCHIYHNQTVTIFAPPDDAFRLHKWLNTRFLVLISYEVGDTSGSLAKGSYLFSWACAWKYNSYRVMGKEAPDGGGDFWINNLNITRPNIYNDGRVTVHGVERFFVTDGIDNFFPF